jgi:TRAP-type mannitol/chloroaromatic compound transport system substrate-binding protein
MNASYRIGAAAIAAVALLGASESFAQQKARWNCPSAYPSTLGTLGKIGTLQVENLNKSGLFDAKYFEPGALVPALQTFDAIQQGSADCSHTNLGFYLNKNLAFAVFTTVPFGPSAGEYLAWMEHGGGNQLAEEMTKPFNIYAPVSMILPPEASGWFRREIKSVDDLRGLKMRFFGLGARVMDKFGVATQLLAAGDIYPALERGVIDATEFSQPSLDVALGFHQVAKHYYFPGWHQQASLLHFFMSRPKHDALSAEQKHIVKLMLGEGVRFSIAEGEALQFKALAEIKSKGVTIHKWPPDFLKALRDKWLEVVADVSKESADFKRAYDSLEAFRRDYAVWKDLGFLE